MLKTQQNPFLDPVTRITSPQYNPYIAKLQDEENAASIYFGDNLRNKSGTWREQFPNQHPSHLVLEIGSHKGRTLVELAADHPDMNFLGMDITFKRVILTSQRAKARKLQNVRTILCNARHLNRMFAPGELDAILIFFPDPWPKAKHAKNRLFNEEFCAQALQCLSPNGYLWLKTDDLGYFESMCAIAAANHLHVRSNALVGEKTYLTSFEEKFKLQKLPTYEVFLGKAASECF